MAAILDSFTSEKQLSTSAEPIVSASSSEKKFIGKATFTNTSASSVTVTVWRLLTATTPTTGSGGNWLDARIIQPGKVWWCDKLQSHVLGNSMSVFASASVISVVNADISGVTES